MNVQAHCPATYPTISAKGHRYHVNLAGLQAVCDANYLRLMKVAPTGAAGTSSRIHIEFQGHEASATLKIVEQTRYTTLLTLSLTTPLHSWLSLPELTVRLYHDVKMAEVIGASGHRYLNARYEYPNAHMHQPDEKYQLNTLLAEWLDHCMVTGYTPDSVNI
ncbi:DUF1249 domain-containing protein [Sansalvadorimonas sp. 2012CJ34-2]|uniref:DUF1249 domain-containing protein n=1 Tax=Parendozoicomonas callyspongiae TaxID=2942213 RepID=A0ABT0PLC6_9GAMM|nr:DUF1249 domain-containing protein [Sansalvadorimonas sp. 2012CJ34-2]MCL6272175.1 DUF1249 domain-containing protein [Sansalvadorimonas sp. 2012CJ34-2]